MSITDILTSNSNLSNAEQIVHNNWSHLEAEIDEGLKSGISNKSHEEIVTNIKRNVRLKGKIKNDK